jgi:hypothetical protein
MPGWSHTRWLKLRREAPLEVKAPHSRALTKDPQMRTILFVLAPWVIASFLGNTFAGQLPPIPAKRLEQISGWLGRDPVFFTPPFADRGFWDRAAASRRGHELLEEADRRSGTPIPELNEDLYSEFNRTGQRESFETPFAERTTRLGLLLFAEGFSNDGTRMPLIEKEIESILDEPSWASPAHAAHRANWSAAHDVVDLAAAARAWNLAMADYLLGDRLSQRVRDRIRDNVRSRVLAPYLERVRSSEQGDYLWMISNNNWNAVCNAGVLGSALLLGEDLQERAEFVAAFERYTAFFIAGFSDDGYCHEGLGYWSYGFRHYVMGAELIRLATDGQLDLLGGAKQRRIAEFGRRWEIVNGLVPAFGDEVRSDEPKDSPPPNSVLDFAILRLGADGTLRRLNSGTRLIHTHPLGAQLYSTAFDLSLARPQEGSLKTAAAGASQGLGLREWFPNGGALIARRRDPSQGLAAAFKGGHNDQPHNHNDLGSFVIVRDGRLILTDLGRDAYVKDTFGPKRYESDVMNSYGHPVPRVAGRLQRLGRSARAETVSTEFTDSRDVWTIDLTTAYDVPELVSLTRTFLFDREGDSSVEVIDSVRFRSPQEFGVALVLVPGQQFSKDSDGRLHVNGTDGSSAGVTISLHADNGKLQITESPILGIVKNEAPRGTRIGIDFAEPILEATLQTVIRPAP